MRHVSNVVPWWPVDDQMTSVRLLATLRLSAAENWLTAGGMGAVGLEGMTYDVDELAIRWTLKSVGFLIKP